MKTRGSSESSDSNDIDLEEVLKTIEPFDELDKKLCAAKPATSTTRNEPSKKDPVHGNKLERKHDEEADVPTSFSSNNGHGRSEGPSINASARARRRNAKFGSGIEDVATSAIDSGNLTSSNLDTGLWRGKSLWNLNGDQALDPPEVSKASLMPPSELAPGEPASKDSPGTLIAANKKGNSKPGKYDWLGLLDDSDEEKGDSTANADQVLTGLSLDTNIHENASHVLEPRGKSNKSSWSENLSSKKPSLKGSESEFLGSRKIDSKSRKIEMATKDEDGAKKISSRLWGDSDLLGSGGQNVGGGRGKFQDAMGEENETSGGGLKAPVLPQRKSLLEEDEKADRSYTPTFLGGSPEGVGRRRRRREGASALPPRSTLNPNFDPLDIFSVPENSSKLEDTSKSQVDLPDWLTGSSKKMSVVKENEPDLSHGVAEGEVEKEIEQDAVKEEEKHKDMEAHKSSYSEKSKEVNSQPSVHSKKNISDAKKRQENTYDVHDSSEFIMQTSAEQHNQRRQKDDSLTSRGIFLPKQSEGNIKRTSRSASDGSHSQSIVHSDSDISSKEGAKSSKITEEDEVSQERKEKSSIRRKVKKKDGSHSKNKQRSHSHIKSKPKKKDHTRDRDISEDADLSAPSERMDSRTAHEKQYAALERQYQQRERQLEESSRRVEQLEEELARMRYLEGEVENLKAVVHVLELEKSAAEALVESLQARHSEQLKRLGDVHWNEVETLRKALLREEKRGAEEVKRLVEDHRKTLDRLMDANIKLEEEFRTRMLEARRDWGRDVEAMRLAYQQSNNAAITNASLAMLTGHSFGSETKDKGENDVKEESSAKPESMHTQEVKELSEKVDRVESIMNQAMNLIVPQAKFQSEELPAHGKGAQVKGRARVVGSIRKHGAKLRKAKEGQRQSKDSSLSRKARVQLHKAVILSEESGISENSDSEESLEHHNGGSTHERIDGSRKDAGDKARRISLPKEMAEQRNERFCDYCKCCRDHNKGLKWFLGRSISTGDPTVHLEKHSKEGHNKNVHFRDGELWRTRKKMFAWKKHMDFDNIHWSKKEGSGDQEPVERHFTLSEGPLLNRNVTSTLKASVNIIDPKEYLVKLATANLSNLFQPSGMVFA